MCECSYIGNQGKLCDFQVDEYSKWPCKFDLFIFAPQPITCLVPGYDIAAKDDLY